MKSPDLQPAERSVRASLFDLQYIYDWLIDHVYFLVPAQAYAGQFLSMFKEVPPRQKVASFSLDQVMEKLQTGSGSK